MAPNPIDFDYVFKQFPNIFDSGNVVVLATVLSIFGLWFIGLLIARRADEKDAYKASDLSTFPTYHIRSDLKRCHSKGRMFQKIRELSKTYPVFG